MVQLPPIIYFGNRVMKKSWPIGCEPEESPYASASFEEWRGETKRWETSFLFCLVRKSVGTKVAA